MDRRILPLCLFLSLPAIAQVEMQQSYSYGLPHFYFDALNFKADQGKSRLDFYFQIPYDEIQFTKQGNEFKSSYEISLQLIDEEGNSALEQTWDVRPACQSFDETTSRSIFSSSERQIIVPPGNYTLQVTVADSETKRSFMEKRAFTARDYASSSASISDIMLLKSFLFLGRKEDNNPECRWECYLTQRFISNFLRSGFPGSNRFGIRDDRSF